MENRVDRVRYNVFPVLWLTVVPFFGTFSPSLLGELQVHLKMEDTLVDSAGGDHNGTLVDGHQGFHAFVPGITGRALALSSISADPGPINNDYVRIPYGMTDDGALAMWFYVEDVYNYVTLFDNAVQADDWEMWIYATGIVRFRIQSGGEVSANLHGLAADGDARGDWFHIAVTWQRLSPTTVENAIYVNGRRIESRQGPWVDPGTAVFLGGGHTGNDAGIGKWDDVRLYDHVLDESEIRWLAKHTLAFEPAELHLKEGQSTSYALWLDYPPGSDPQAEVAVTITPDEHVALNGLEAGQPLMLVLDPGSSQAPQTVRVLAVDNEVNTGDRSATLIHTLSSDDPQWNAMRSASVSVFILDDDLGCGAWGYLPMDLNRDCYVSLADFLAFASQWMMCTDPSGQGCIRPAGLKIAAHRGYSQAAPENTLAACNAARGFADLVEFDVRPALDGWLVLMHDGTVDRTTAGAGPVENLTLAEVRALEAGSWFSEEYAGEPVPLMSEAILAVLPDMVPLIERKTGTVEQYMEVLRALRCVNDVVLIAFDWDFLAQVEAIDSTVITGALGSNALTSDTINNIYARGIDFINWEHSTITADELNRVRATGMELWVWTVNSAARIEELLDMGIDGITTDDPALARQLLGQ
ncbi:MAG: hypothetical protein JW828_04955 [Sedimentisphaerales bacterium]|nr:hypothetical protein [Sedimentisphaerales bacterium]